MAYYIFLKSLRSLEKFRKNPHVKIPPKSPSINFQSLAKFKNPILNSKILLLHFRPGYPSRPVRPSAQPAPLAPLLSRRPKPTGRPKPLSPCASLAYLQNFWKYWFNELFSNGKGRGLGPRAHGPRAAPTHGGPRSPSRGRLAGDRSERRPRAQNLTAVEENNFWIKN